jgi:hypothetical protein
VAPSLQAHPVPFAQVFPTPTLRSSIKPI